MVARFHAGRPAAPFRDRLLSGSARGALLMATALGLVLAEDARAGTTIPNNSNNYTLNPAGNPFTVNAGSKVTGLGANYAIYGGPGTQWSVTNNGTVMGGTTTIKLKAVSTLTNNGTISGTSDTSVDLANGGTLINTGSILGATVSVGSEGNTDLQNKVGAVISASGNTGIQLGGSSTVTNAGTISGPTLALGMAAGTLINQSTGMILGGTLFFGQATVTNAGYINKLLTIEGAGTVTNMGTLVNLAIGGLGTVTNTGTIAEGATLQNGGTILNQGAIGAIVGYSGSTTVTNSGTISTVSVRGGGTIINQKSIGSITATSVAATATNTGIIGGITLNAGGSVTNANTIGNVSTYGASAAVTNSGTIGTATLGGGGTLINQAGARMGSGVGSVTVKSVAGTVSNFGTIVSATGQNGPAVTFLAGGTLLNNIGGSIQGSSYGVSAAGGTTITNAGTITGSGGTAVRFSGSGANTIVVQPTSVLNGGVVGSTVTGATNALVLEQNGLLQTSFANFTDLMVAVSGAVTLNGTSIFSNSTTITGGTLVVGDANNPGATLTSANVTVDNGATLQGHGAIVGALTNAGGIVQPGGSIGTLSVSGGFTQTSAGNLVVEVTPTAASLLRVAGQANLAGAVSLIFDPGVYSSKTFPILTAAGITGNFTAVNSTLSASSLSQSVVKNAGATEVDLVLSGSATVTPPVPPPTPVNPPPIVSLTPPPVVIAPTNDTIWTALATAAIEQTHRTSSMLFDRLSSAHANGGSSIAAGAVPPQQAYAGGLESADAFIAQAPGTIASYGGWFRAGGDFTSVEGNGMAPGFHADGGGFLSGIDRPVGDNATVGLAAGYTRAVVSERTGANGTFETPYANLYGRLALGSIDLDGSAGSGYYMFSTGRPTPIGPAVSSPDGYEISSALQASHSMSIGNFRVTPKLGVQFVHLTQEDFSESGAGGFDLTGSKVGTESLRPFVAASASGNWIVDGAEVTPELRLGYSREALSAVRNINVTTVSGTPFLVFGVSPGRNEETAGAGISANTAPGIAFSANYDVAIFGNQFSQIVSAKFSARF
ncbi:MAG TPA: autotransporter domain-containing protein [Stellaceae bacterium]|nr:autotransporter domain-containing protein [Stellaceae bacterium]